MADRAGYDLNLQPTLLAVSTVDGLTPVTLEADPVTHQLQVSSTGGGSGGAVTVADAADVAQGATADAVVAAGAAGTISAKLRRMSADIASIYVRQNDGSQNTVISAALPAGTNIIGSMKLTDGTNVATVKAASTAPVAADPAQVVVLSPNNATAIQTTNWTTATGLNTSNTVSLAGYSTAIVTMANTSTMTAGVLTFEVFDGTNWYPIQMARADSYTAENNYTLNTVANRAWSANIAGFTGFRVRLSTVITGSGTATVGVILTTTPAPASVTVGQVTSANNKSQTQGIAASGTVASSSNPVKVAGSDGTNQNDLKTDSAGQLQIVGSVANAASDAGNPLKIGGVGKTANPTAVTDGQRVNATYDKLGKQVVVGSLRDLKANQVTTITASVAETTIVTAVAAVFLDLYGIIITNTSATAVNVAIKDATAGTTRFNLAIPAGDTRGFMLPESAAMKQSAVNGNWTATSSASVTSLIITALTVQNL